MAMTISELARSGGVGVETVRYYQRRGLLTDPKPSASPGTTGRRHYGAEESQRLNFIRSAKQAGFTLDEISSLLLLDRIDDRDQVRAIAQERVAALNMQISALSAARDALEALSDECSRGDEGACPIIQAFGR